MNTINKLMELANKSSYLRSFVVGYANLVYTTEMNYAHIDELERLNALFAGGMTTYHKEYNKEAEEITILFRDITENTRANHYRQHKGLLEDDIYNLMSVLYPSKTLAKRDDVHSAVVDFNIGIGRL